VITPALDASDARRPAATKLAPVYTANTPGVANAVVMSMLAYFLVQCGVCRFVYEIVHRVESSRASMTYSNQPLESIPISAFEIYQSFGIHHANET